jgi:hypothetical protein
MTGKELLELLRTMTPEQLALEVVVKHPETDPYGNLGSVYGTDVSVTTEQARPHELGVPTAFHYTRDALITVLLID